MDIEKLKERIVIVNTHEAYILVSSNPLDEISGFNNSLKRFQVKSLKDGVNRLYYKCRVRFAKSILGAKDAGRVHMLIDQFLSEEECVRFFPEVMNEYLEEIQRKKRITLQNQRNHEEKTSRNEIKKLTKGRSIRACARDSIVYA